MKRKCECLNIMLCFLMLAGCSRQPELTIVKRSNARLTNLIASGSGFSNNIGTLSAGAEACVAIKPSGESSIRFEFDANGKHFASVPAGYFENSSTYNITAIVEPDFSVEVTDCLKS